MLNVCFYLWHCKFGKGSWLMLIVSFLCFEWLQLNAWYCYCPTLRNRKVGVWQELWNYNLPVHLKNVDSKEPEPYWCWLGSWVIIQAISHKSIKLRLKKNKKQEYKVHALNGSRSLIAFNNPLMKLGTERVQLNFFSILQLLICVCSL